MAPLSWVESANAPGTDFPLENLPYGVFRQGGAAHIGVAIGNRILDLHAGAEEGLFADIGESTVAACRAEALNALMACGPSAWSALRQRITALLDETSATSALRGQVARLLVPMHEAVMQLPCAIGDYSDFYASIHHATRVGKLFRPDNPLLPNYKHLPIGYHGRSSSIVVSGTEIQRPSGQIKSPSREPHFEPTQALDYELEVGVLIGPESPLGRTIPIQDAEQHIFGLCLVNDWSARDIQSWEYQPLGPFLAKSFATTISPWIVPMAALAPYRVPAHPRAVDDPELLPYLRHPEPEQAAIDLNLHVSLQSESMRQNGIPPLEMGKSNLRDLYWTLAQLIAHQTSNGCNLRPGDLLASGTVSGPVPGSEGCLLEKRLAPEPLQLPTGETRTWLEDGDRVVLRACAQAPGLARIGFGECSGTVTAAVHDK